MLEKLRTIFTIPDLRRKVLLTIALLAVYRIGWQIPLPIIDQAQISEFAKSMASGSMGQFLEKVSVFSASQLTQATIFGLGIMPYISASIILQLLGTVYKPLEDLKKEGEAGRKKNYRVHSLSDSRALFASEFSVSEVHADERRARPDRGGIPAGGQRYALVPLASQRRFDHDRRQYFSDVAG